MTGPQSLGWALVQADQQKPTARPLRRCACSILRTECGGAATQEDMLCDPCRVVQPSALEDDGPQLVHVCGVRPHTFPAEPLPHSTQPLDTMMRVQLG